MLWALASLTWSENTPYRGYKAAFWYGWPRGHKYPNPIDLNRCVFLELETNFILGEGKRRVL